MKIQQIESFEVSGFAIRTKNSDEANKSTAKIASLWDKFYANIANFLTNESKIYGVYTEYESDYTGKFTVVAAATNLSNLQIKNVKTIKIEAGNYLVFSGKGEMPQIVIELWDKIWKYFNSDTCTHKRVYTTDFEYYKNSTDIEIYISVK